LGGTISEPTAACNPVENARSMRTPGFASFWLSRSCLPSMAICPKAGAERIGARSKSAAEIDWKA
jgi:hypothetical protein